jgi:hypothetical protein
MSIGSESVRSLSLDARRSLPSTSASGRTFLSSTILASPLADDPTEAPTALRGHSRTLAQAAVMSRAARFGCLAVVQNG